MTKSELIELITAKQKHLPAKDVELALKQMLEIMSDALATGQRIEIRGFGSFSLHFRPPRQGRNPKTGEAVALAGKYVPHFKPGKDLRERVKQITGGQGVDVVYDPVGGTVFDESMRCINWDGRILTIGFTSGVWPKAAVNHILIKHISVIGVRAGEIGRRNPAIGERCDRELTELLESGAIDPYVCAGFPLEQAVEAMDMLTQRKVVGKVVVTMNQYTI
jgi:integration host factor subunit beta